MEFVKIHAMIPAQMSDDFHLCQTKSPDGRPQSCASCCGTYNYLGHDRALVTGVLVRQTEIFAAWDGTDRDIERVRREIEEGRPEVRFEVIYTCPFSGFLDEDRTRIGCLLHPRARGRDLRDYCRYGHRTCGEARCTSYTYLNRDEARAVAAAAADWYIYGLCITDVDLVKGFVNLCERRLCAPLRLGRVWEEEKLARALGGYLALKENWPFARDPGRFGKYYFVDRSYHIHHIDYRRLGPPRPPHHHILLSLGSVIETGEELEEAISLIDARVDVFLEHYPGPV